MEKNIHQGRTFKRILISGPESTGKSKLTERLSKNFGGVVVPEYARGYIENLGRPYEYNDVEHIARKQSQTYDELPFTQDWIFFDTWLIITKVWFEFVYGSFPDWIDERIKHARFDIVLLCVPDIPWISDSVRENGGEMREKLFSKYKYEFDRFGLEWELVTGSGEKRLNRAINLINNHIPNGTH